MKEGRALLAFAALGLVLVLFAVYGPKLGDTSPVFELPTVAASAAPPPVVPPPGTPLKGPLLLQNPALSKTQIAFDFAGEIWSVARDGGDGAAARHRAAPQQPPGLLARRIADRVHRNVYDGNTDVYVVAVDGRRAQAPHVPSRRRTSRSAGRPTASA